MRTDCRSGRSPCAWGRAARAGTAAVRPAQARAGRPFRSPCGGRVCRRSVSGCPRGRGRRSWRRRRGGWIARRFAVAASACRADVGGHDQPARPSRRFAAKSRSGSVADLLVVAAPSRARKDAAASPAAQAGEERGVVADAHRWTRRSRAAIANLILFSQRNFRRVGADELTVGGRSRMLKAGKYASQRFDQARCARAAIALLRRRLRQSSTGSAR